MIKRISTLVLIILSLSIFTNAQQAEVTISLDEQFFDALLDAMLNNSPLEFPIAQNPKSKIQNSNQNAQSFQKAYFSPKLPKAENSKTYCDEKIVLQREVNGVRTAVRFRDGKIYAPIAFSGSYNPPLIGCIDFSGYAETNIDLQFDQSTQTLYGRATVLNVQLGGAANIGGNILARLVQNAIDQKINPIKILEAGKISFNVPIQNNGTLNMKAVDVRHDIGQGVLNVHVIYQFQKAS